MRVGKLRKCMDFTMNVYVNMDQLMFGDIVVKFLIIYHYQLLLMIEYFVCMEVYLLRLILLTKYESLIESKRFPMKDLCANFFGQIRIISTDGVFLLEGLDIFLVETLLKR